MEPSSPERRWPLFQRAMRADDAVAPLRLYEPDAVIADADGQIQSGHTWMRDQTRTLVAAKAGVAVMAKGIVHAGDLALMHRGRRSVRPPPTQRTAAAEDGVRIGTPASAAGWAVPPAIGGPPAIGR